MDKLDNIEEVYKKELFNGEPIVYKDVKLYPVKCNKLIDFYSCIQVLLYDPLRYPTEVSALPRLYFLTDIINHQNDEEYINKNPMLLIFFAQLQYLLGLVFSDEQNVELREHKGRWYISVKSDDKWVDIKAKDFDVIRKIILHQNGIDYDDTFVHEDIRQWITEQQAKEDGEPATLEDYKEAFMLSLHIADESVINNVTIRRFNRIVEKTITRENYNIQMTASMSGFVTFKGKIDHWLHIEKKNRIFDKYFKTLNN